MTLHPHLALRAPWSNLAVCVNRAIDDRPHRRLGIQQEAICYNQWFKQRLILSVSKPSISQRSQDTVEPSMPAREFNLKAYAAITWHNDRASLGLEPRLADHRSQAARTATLPTAPPGQALWNVMGPTINQELLFDNLGELASELSETLTKYTTVIVFKFHTRTSSLPSEASQSNSRA